MILITGGAGYIGSNIAKLLVSNGFDILSIDNLSNGDIRNTKYGKFFKCDLLDEKLLNYIFKKEPIKYVIHCASYKDAIKSELERDEYYKNNVIASINLFNAMKNNNVNNIVFASSAAVYGDCSLLPIEENKKGRPLSVYGNTKLMLEYIISDYFKSYVILRLFNVAGDDFDAEVGCYNNKSLVHSLIRSCINDDIFLYNGINRQTRNGTAIRDYLHVYDVANSFYKSLFYLDFNKDKSDIERVFNICTGIDYTVDEIKNKVSSIIGKKINFKIGDKDRVDVDGFWGNNTNAKTFLEWNPINSEIENIIKSSIKWENKIGGKK